MIYVEVAPSPGPAAVLVCQNSQYRDGRTNQKSTPKRSLFESRFESHFLTTNGITHRWPCATVRIELGKRRHFNSGKGQP